MSWEIAFLLLMAAVMVPMFLGVPVALAFFGANILGALIFFGRIADPTPVEQTQ